MERGDDTCLREEEVTSDMDFVVTDLVRKKFQILRYPYCNESLFG